MACLKAQGYTHCLLQPMCPSTNPNSAGAALIYSVAASQGSAERTCVYANGTQYGPYTYWGVVPESSGGGMSATQLDMLMFGFLMVMWCIGVVLGVRLTQTRTRYGGDA